MRAALCVLFIVVSCASLRASDQQPIDDSLHGQVDTTAPVVLADPKITIAKLDYAAVPLFDALTALVRTYNLSMAIDSSVTGSLSLHLVNTRLNDALQFIIHEHRLTAERVGAIVRISRPAPPVPPLPPLAVEYAGGLLSVDLNRADLERFVRSVAEKTGLNIVIQSGTIGIVSGKLSSVPPEKALAVLLATSGFSLQKADGVFYVGQAKTAAPALPISGTAISCDSGLVSVHASGMPLAEVIRALGEKCQISLSPLLPLEGTVSVFFDRLTLDDALVDLLANTPYSFKATGTVYVIGSRDSEDLYDTKLVRLNHMPAAILEPLIPATLTKQVTVKVVKEHNGFLLTGPRTSIAKVEEFLAEADVAPAQVLFEVLVVDYTTTDRAEFSLTANNFTKDDHKDTYYPGLDLEVQGTDLNDDLNSLSRHLGVSNLGKLPASFYVRLQWLQSQGKANIRSHPQIAALNGHSASISIGTTQYYLLESNTTYPSQQTTVTTQTSQHFEKVEADMSLEVVPYVNSTDELIVDIKPEFNTPAEAFNPDIPPTINKRVLNSTVRLHDGETIVLGGLVQTSKSATISKFPVLGSLPVLGRLFQNRKSTDIKSELIIYLTPHVYYGSEGAVPLEKVLKDQ